MAKSTLLSLVGQNFKRRKRNNRKEDLDEVRLQYAVQDFISETISKFPDITEFTFECRKPNDRVLLVNLLDTAPWPGVRVTQVTESLYRVEVETFNDEFDF